MIYEKMDKQELEQRLKEEQEFHSFMVKEQPGETDIVCKTQERIDKLQKILQSYEK